MNWFKNLSKQQKIGIIFIGIILVLLYLNFFIKPKIKEIKKLKNEYIEIKQQIKEAKIKELEAKQMELEYVELTKILEEIFYEIPKNTDQPEVYSLLENITGSRVKCKMEFNNFNPIYKDEGLEIIDKGSYNEFAIQVDFKGEYHTVGMFLDELSNLSRIIIPQKIYLEKYSGDQSEEKETLIVKMILGTYLFK
ncbi:MAG: type 4a pilus biogenesis protein PilO [bacterium]